MLKFTKLAMVTIGALSLAACGDDDNSSSSVSTGNTDTSMEYEVSVKNLTNYQPFSPLAVLLHDSDAPWTIGSPASDALENLAESGDNSDLLASGFVDSYASSDGVLPFGQSTTVTVSTSGASANYLSLVTMLVNTNDAFTGLNSIDISQLAVNDSLKYTPGAYDAGTEANSEEAGTIPGPADGGEGYNVARDDINNVVTMHSGVIGYDDGLTGSVLNNEYKFDNPVMSVTITRTK